VGAQIWKCQRASGLVLIWNHALPKLRRQDGIPGDDGVLRLGILPFSILLKRLRAEQSKPTAAPAAASDADAAAITTTAAAAAAAAAAASDATSDAAVPSDKESKTGTAAEKGAAEASAATATAAAAAAAAAAEEAEIARKTEETMRVDRMAISHLSIVLLPLVVGFSVRSLVMEQHHGWYSWVRSVASWMNGEEARRRSQPLI